MRTSYSFSQTTRCTDAAIFQLKEMQENPKAENGIQMSDLQLEDRQASDSKALFSRAHRLLEQAKNVTIRLEADKIFAKSGVKIPLEIRKNKITVATGAGAVYLLYKTIQAGLKSPPGGAEPLSIARLAVEHDGGGGGPAGGESRELRKLLAALGQRQDDYSKSVVLNSITRCVYLLEAEAAACTYEDIRLVASCLDERDKEVKIQALNALKAFSGIRKFRIKIQEYVPKILELVTSTWDAEMHVAGLRLLNGLPLPEHSHPLLRRAAPALVDFLQTDGPLAQVQVLKLLVKMAQKEDLLYDVLNCQVQPDFLRLLHASQPGGLLREALVLVETLHEGCLSPAYRAARREYNEQSLHQALFGEDSRLADHLLAVFVHPEEEVQLQACKVILSLQLGKEDAAAAATLSSHSFETTFDGSFEGSFFNAGESIC
ncbi:armadillo repeat-containing protein 12 [Rhea pennata]|uniref:armadillo repeat-containing protein 12 n=1 Tax=Rhea pennata TaxID=8795 RepID=UPI002E26455E